MAKDPAINWYFDNWDGGTKLFTRHQKGCYMDLLSAQFHCGHLTIENIKQILGSDFAEWDKCLKAKFEIDENGLFFNERTEHEISKRVNERERKSKGGLEAMKKRWGDKYLNNSLNKIDNKILNNSLETEIETESVLKKGGMEEKKFLSLAPKSLPESELQSAYEIYWNKLPANEKQTLTKDWINSMWNVFYETEKSGNGWYASVDKVFYHFKNWITKQKINGNFKSAGIVAGSASSAKMEALRKW